MPFDLCAFPLAVTAWASMASCVHCCSFCFCSFCSLPGAPWPFPFLATFPASPAFALGLGWLSPSSATLPGRTCCGRVALLGQSPMRFILRTKKTCASTSSATPWSLGSLPGWQTCPPQSSLPLLQSCSLPFLELEEAMAWWQAGSGYTQRELRLITVLSRAISCNPCFSVAFLSTSVLCFIFNGRSQCSSQSIQSFMLPK